MDDQAIGQSSRAEAPRSPSRSLQATDVDHHNSPQPCLFQDLQYEVASEVADAGDPVRPTLHDSSHESDTETVISQGPEAGDASTDSLVDSESIVQPLAWDVRPSALTQAGFVALDLINVRDIFTHQAWDEGPSSILTRGVPFCDAARFKRDHFWHGIGQPGENHETMEIVHPPPRMLLFKPLGGRKVKNKLLDRFTKFAQGQRLELLSASAETSRSAADMRARRSRTRVDTMDQRVQRAEALLSMGEISAARHALEGSPVVPGSEETYNALTGANRRPPEPRDPIPEDILQIEPVRPFELDKEGFLQNLRKARRGAAGGPSGMRTKHLLPLLDNIEDSNKCYEIAQAFAQAQIPDKILNAIRVGQLTAIEKPNGGVRGIVVGDVVRRLIAKTMSDQMMARFETATKPFQYALSTRAGCESIAHIVQSATDNDARATVLSIDGVGASRRAMMTALHRMPDGDAILPFVLQFYGRPSTHLWEDENGTVREIQQGEGGEQGDPLMQALFALGQHDALCAVQEFLHPFMAFLDDLHVVSVPERVASVRGSSALESLEDRSESGENSSLESVRRDNTRLRSHLPQWRR